MRRWKLSDGRFITESPSLGPAQYYRLGRDFAVEREYKQEKSRIDDETHSISFVVLDRKLMCRHQIDRPRKDTIDQSKVEEDDLMLLLPDEEPTAKQVKEAVAVFVEGADAVEKAKQARIDKLASSAAPSMQDVVRRLAERMVRHDDERAKAMMSCLNLLAKVHRAGETDADSLRRATEAITTGAKLLTAEPAAKQAEHPSFVESPTLELVDALEALRRDLRGRADYDDASKALRVAIYHLTPSLRLR